jgi:hypothetical protein
MEGFTAGATCCVSCVCISCGGDWTAAGLCCCCGGGAKSFMMQPRKTAGVFFCSRRYTILRSSSTGALISACGFSKRNFRNGTFCPDEDVRVSF